VGGGHTDEAFEAANRRFNYYLDKMIWAFDEVRKGYPGEEKFWAADNSDFDSVGCKQYYDTVQEGINIFAKHFRTLWW
jgi:hypothetical protein